MGDEGARQPSATLWMVLWTLTVLCAFGGVAGASSILGQLWVFSDWYVPWLLPVLVVPLLLLPLTIGLPGRTHLILAALVCAAVIAIGLTGTGLLVWARASGWQPELCCEATAADIPSTAGMIVALAYACAGAAMLVVFVAAVRRDRSPARRSQSHRSRTLKPSERNPLP